MNGSTIDRALPGVRGMFRPFWVCVLEPEKGSCDVARHGDVARAVVVVPRDGKSTVFGAGWIDREGIVFAQCG